MPLYEYQCAQCRRRFKRLVGVVANASPISCPQCGSTDAARLISRFARKRSEDDTLDSLANDMEGVDEGSPAAMRRLMRDMGSEMGEDLGDDFEEMLEEEQSGGADPDASDSF
ncbi:MAG: zinc ribbon domain-containing protein [Armatimonadetes bacterium]|nr:zinc ribbon domain-containing protein [Armatimonadota bacterium]MDE2205357.1 zinc ribbon domain-containing protein [Armatimonadota bacterium]